MMPFDFVAEVRCFFLFAQFKSVRIKRFTPEEKKHLTSATKSNGIIHTCPSGTIFHALAAEYPDVRTDHITSIS